MKKMSKSKQGKRNRNRGLNFERAVAKQLRHVFPDVGRQLEFQADQANGVDLRNTGVFKIQCKRNKGYCPITEIEEVKTAGIPVLISKADNKPAMAVIPFENLIELMEAYYNLDLSRDYL